MTDHLATKEDLDLINENTADFIAFSYYSFALLLIQKD
ncbi:unnamed protein product [Lactobacillus johnsonii FI9785]|uniref:6-phospho-beta-glucosidase n=1 Tax=Lactobacillus johnsonii (strain FI9785) TaxID=633699 RepID=D0R622_LACJF|nr:unnamed protein product [Lactobacillus johnsonii FI9785]